MARQPVLVLISEDPRASHRANEAMRIALGVVAGENEVDIVLAGAGAHLLDEDTDELVDGDDIGRPPKIAPMADTDCRPPPGGL